ncbi:MAG: adenylate/guanylate cyclase domain-containing protein, partial [Pseudomonadota bacterium]
RGRREIIHAFSQYLSPDLVQQLAEHPERLQLGGEQRTITVMFADIRNFTTISERYRDDPQGLTALINRFLTPMTDIVLARSGTIDKYIGDSIMAFWNAPLSVADHAAKACASALEMAAALRRLNDELVAEPSAGQDTETDQAFPPTASRPSLAMGIGINTGASVVGNLGSEQRFNYSALGDAVNLASRLESLTKSYGVPILISEATRNLAPTFAALEVDLIAVKGKTVATRTFGLLGPPEEASAEDFRRLVDSHDRMLAAYRAQNWPEASALAETCRAMRPDLGRLYEVYLERIEAYRTSPPGAAWDGVHVAKTK